MKKLILVMAALIIGAGAINAQDMAQATEVYNSGAESLSIGNNASALEKFKEALTLAQACGDEGADIVSNCKNIIPQIQLSIAKELYNTKNFDGALEQLKVTIDEADEYDNEDVEKEAKELIPTIYMQKGNVALNKKAFADAAKFYAKVVDYDEDNGMAYLRLGQSLSRINKVEDALEALEKAAELGKEKDANKQISNIYVNDAAKALKAKDYKEAIEKAKEANEYLENPNAMKIAGTAYSQLKDNKNAVEYLKKYVEMKPNAKDANTMYYTIGALSQMMGDKAAAIEYYTKVLTDPKLGPTVQPLIESLK